MSKFYDGTKLLSLKDIDREPPEIYLCVGNRTAGKTFFFKRMLVRRFLKAKKKFCVVVRFKYEMDGIAENFFKDIEEIEFNGMKMTEVNIGKDLFKELYLDGKPCGYVVALNTADTIKKYSSRFVDVDAMFMDEFQSEVGKYCQKELDKFMSVHTSIARGGGQHSRYVPVYMCSNSVTIINPYYTAFGISKRLQHDTKFMKGKGWVLEHCYVESAAEAIKGSGFGKAFSDTSYMGYATNNDFLLDNNNLIEKCKGEKRMQFILICDGQEYGLWLGNNGVYYVSYDHDPNWPIRLTLKLSDHTINTMMLRTYKTSCKTLKQAFEMGMVRFEDLSCKDMFIDFIGFGNMQ